MAARILLVEDDPDVKLLMEHILATGGYQVVSVETVRYAAPLIESQPFDLLLTDGNLSDGNGVDLADLAVAKGVKALIVTGSALNIPAARMVKHEVMLKPLRPAELLAALERLFAKPGDGNVVEFPKPA